MSAEIELRAAEYARLNEMQNRSTAVRTGGWSLIVAAVGFMLVFTYLAARFNYPDVLDGNAREVLPKLLALGMSGRAVWMIYALLPLLLVPASVGIATQLRAVAPNAMRVLAISGVVAAVSMLLGLARWPTIHWEMATAYATAGDEARVAMDALFRGLNLYLGNFIGEFVGEMALNAVFVLSGYALVRSRRPVLGYSGIVVGLIGIVAAFRNVTDAVALIAEVNNGVLPVWLVVMGVMCVRAAK